MAFAPNGPNGGRHEHDGSARKFWIGEIRKHGADVAMSWIGLYRVFCGSDVMICMQDTVDLSCVCVCGLNALSCFDVHYVQNRDAVF